MTGTRRLILLRHAKSDWPDVPDRDRPLAKRGRRDAPKIGRWLREHAYVPEVVICSDARRARQTWDRVARELGGSPSVTFEPRAYAASATTLLYLVMELPATSRTALLIGHNPGVSELATSLALPPDGDDAPIRFPTAAVAVLDFPGDWADLAPGQARLTDFTTPPTSDGAGMEGTLAPVVIAVDDLRGDLMSLTFSSGPLSGSAPETVNYRIDGPAHKLLMQGFPRRLRAVLGGQTVFDTTRAMLLHETGLPPQVYVPLDDIRADLIQPTDHHTYCPFKGTASYWTVTAGGQVAENAIWGYPEPNDEASWLQGYAGFYWNAMDEWYDEDERVEGHLRDPYHRVDVRRSSRPVRVLLGDTVLAETTSPLLLSETGLPNRFYIPAADVRQDLLEESDKHTVCPYKGTASYWTISAGDRKLADAVWSYPQAEGDSAAVSGYLSFLHDDLTVEVGEPASR